MDQVERALLVVSGDAASGKLVADSQVSHTPPTPNTEKPHVPLPRQPFLDFCFACLKMQEGPSYPNGVKGYRPALRRKGAL